jgi:hypothetical protein
MLMGCAARYKGFGIDDNMRSGVDWAGVCQRAEEVADGLRDA